MDVRETQLFVDDYLIDSYVRVQRTIHQPQKFVPEPVLRADKPWEGNAVVLYGTVLRHPETGRFQMWYQTFKKVPPPENTYICYTESEDGIRWAKPSLGLVEYRGSKENNIVLRGAFTGIDSPSVVYDPDDADEARRYKMLFYANHPETGNGLFAAFSPDGVHWNLLEKPVAPNVGDRTNVMIDPSAKRRFVAYSRRRTMWQEHRRRVVYRLESEDFLTWTEPELALAPDLADPYDVQFYGMSAFRYGSLYLGFLQCLHSKEDRNDLQLVVSRDNKRWLRPAPRTTFLTNGPTGTWDSAWISAASNAPIACPVGTRLWIYYEGRNAAHGQEYPFPLASIGVATLRRDGFASVDAGPVEGILTTKPFHWPGGRLLVNLNARGPVGVTDGFQQAGRARLEILDEEGNLIPGFSYEECEPFTQDSVSHEFQWKSRRKPDELVGRKIRLRLHLVNTELYSFRAEA